MFRRTISTLAALALLAAPLLGGPSAGPAQTGEGQRYEDVGHADIRNQKLRKRCHTYRVRYVVRPPSEEWSAVIQFYTPKNRKLGVVYLDVNTPNPLSGTRPFTICGATVKPGRFKVQVEIIYNVGRRELSAFGPPRYFRLRR